MKVNISDICDMFFDKNKEPWKYAKLYTVLELLTGKQLSKAQVNYFELNNIV